MQENFYIYIYIEDAKKFDPNRDGVEKNVIPKINNAYNLFRPGIRDNVLSYNQICRDLEYARDMAQKAVDSENKYGFILRCEDSVNRLVTTIRHIEGITVD